MKYFKNLGLYKISNCTFNPVTREAFSYGWWKFTKQTSEGLIFNDYNYSPTTIKHQYKTRTLLRDLGIDIDHFIEAPRGLDDLEEARTRNVYALGRALVVQKYARIKTSSDVDKFRNALEVLTKLGFKTTANEINHAQVMAELSRSFDLKQKREMRLKKPAQMPGEARAEFNIEPRLALVK